MVCSPAELALNPHGCILESGTTQLTEVQFGLLLALIIGVPLYVKFEDPIPVAVALTLVSGLAIPALPGQAQHIAWVVMFTGLAVGVFGAAYKGMIR